LKAHDLITSPAYVVIKAANEFKDKTTAINQLARAGPWRPGLPVEGDHRFRWMTTTCSGRWRPGQLGCGRV